MIVSRLFKITLLACLLFVGQGAQAMLSTIGKLGKFVPSFSTNFALPKEDPANLGAFVSRSWCRERYEKIKKKSDEIIGDLREENTYLKNIFTDEAFRDNILNFKQREEHDKATRSKISQLETALKNYAKQVKKLKATAKSEKAALELKHKNAINSAGQKLKKALKQDKNNGAKLVKEHEQSIKKLNNEHDLALKTLKKQQDKLTVSLKSTEKKLGEFTNKNGESAKQIRELLEENANLRALFPDAWKAVNDYKKLKNYAHAQRREVAQLKKTDKESEEKFEKERARLKADLEKAKTSNNNRQSNSKQYSWWEKTKQRMFNTFKLASITALWVSSIWATNTPVGRKIYDKLLDAKLLEKKIAQAIRERDLDELKDIIEQYRDYKVEDNLWQYIDVKEFAQLALTKNDKGEDFAKGLELLLQEQIVKIADNGIIVTHTIPNSTTTFTTCKTTYNISRYVQSAEALNVIIKYGKKLKQEIADYNAKSEHKTKMAPFDIQELLNQVILNPETNTYETAADIYEKNGNQELIKAAKNTGALTSKAVCEEVVKYLKSDISTIQKLTDTKITTATIAIRRKLVP